jgi:2Fe-2S ferredoxin
VASITLHVTGRDGQRRSHVVPAGRPLMFLLRDVAREPVEGLCGGCATCGTCHVFVAGDWAGRLPPPGPHEAAMLDMLEHARPGTSRLACQIAVTPALDGLTLELAPEE